MSLALTKSPQLYAVVDRGAPAPLARQTIAELREQKHDEIAAKQAIDRANAVLDTLEARRATYKQQIAELKKRDDLAAARTAHIEDEALRRMEQAKLSSAAGFHVTFSARPAPAAVQVDNQSLIPAEYMRQPKTPPKEPDKVAIKAALAKDEELVIPGVRLTQKVCLVRG